MRDRKRCASQSVPNRRHTTKDHATKVEPPTTIAAGTLDETTASSRVATLTTTLGYNKRLPSSRFSKKSITIKEEKTSVSSAAMEATTFTNAWLARDLSRGSRQHPLKLPPLPI